MPIREFLCPNGHRFDQITLGPTAIVSCACAMCGSMSQPLMSVPAVVRIAGVGVPNDSSKDKIREPYWRDQETGLVTSMY